MNSEVAKIANEEEAAAKNRSSLDYVLITPARNEAAFIGQTINAVISQTHLPRKWVIVSDGSSDGTDEIVKRYADNYGWIELIQMPKRAERHFAGKAHAFNTGFGELKHLEFDVVGNLDGDISFPPDHFAFLLNEFAKDASLGVAGTSFVENSSVAYDYEYVNPEHVSGQCQLFRRECLADVGGYQPIKGGGVDWIAVTTARMKGWRTRTFTNRVFVHHRVMGTGVGSVLKARFRYGKQDYYLGGHPIWEIFRGCYQMTRKPYVLGGALILCGYLWAAVTKVKKEVPKDLEDFRRDEQMRRLRLLIRRWLTQERASDV